MADLAGVLAEERRIMNLYAPHYERATLTNSYVYRIVRAQFVAWIAATLRADGRDPARLSLLETGCGPGTTMTLLARAGFARMAGIDLAEGMLAQARRQPLAGVQWIRALIEQPPFRGPRFDVIVACFTLHHLFDERAFFRLVDETLRPGGWFFILEYNGDSGLGDRTQGSGRRRVGDAVRRLFAQKNRRTLAASPQLPVLQNPAHRLLSFAEMQRAVARPEEYELRREARGLVLPTLLPVLVEESRFDRAVAHLADRADRVLETRFGALFQRIAGRRLGAPGTPIS